MATKEILLQKIGQRKARIGIIGLGYVGLPLAVEFARAGFRVLGYDVSERVVKAINDGRSHIQDVPATSVAALVKEGLLKLRMYMEPCLSLRTCPSCPPWADWADIREIPPPVRFRLGC